LFAYGTLLCPDIWVQVTGHDGPPFPATLSGYQRYRVRGEDYPALVAEPGVRVNGVLYRGLTDLHWQQLDRFEGDLYRRVRVVVDLDDGQRIEAFTYLLDSAKADRIEPVVWEVAPFLTNGKSRFQETYIGFQPLPPRPFIVIEAHRSEYPEPIAFAKGAPLTVGERYEGDEEWNDWFFCTTPGQAGGWVPAQVIERGSGDQAVARADYTARELDVNKGDHVTGLTSLNGWWWCETADRTRSGWIPAAKLAEYEAGP
jgi:gamma-glutamylcyclotransferase (GGCT)/AIG2-like uncharacterized protein YtfP